MYLIKKEMQSERNIKNLNSQLKLLKNDFMLQVTENLSILCDAFHVEWPNLILAKSHFFDHRDYKTYQNTLKALNSMISIQAVRHYYLFLETLPRPASKRK
jgi:uncharacterized phage-like protein YoqJ